MKFFLLIFFLLPVGFASAQFQNIKIDDEGNPEEPSIWINPKNTNNLVAGANISFVYYSFDGGNTWTKQDLSSPYGVWGDPCILSDTAGDFYFIHLSNPPSDIGSWIDRIVCQKSTDNGISWSTGTYAGLNGNKAQDKAWAIADPETNMIFLTWTQFDQYGSFNTNDSSVILFSKSADGGMSWSVPKRISQKAGDCLDNDNTAEGAVPAIGPLGEVYVAWSNRDTLFFDKSLDEGNTWMNQDAVVSDQPGGWDYYMPGLQRCNGLPVTKCDISNSAFRGTIYVNWTDQRNGSDNTDVWLSKSTDGGLTWSPAFKVNDDGLNKQQFLSWMDVDQTNGDVYIIYYDRRNYSDQNTDIYVAYSIDGGETFTNQKISDSPFNPSESSFFGDYSNISAHNGKVAPIWTRQDGAATSIWTANIDFSILAAETPDFRTSQLLLYQNHPNPFSDITDIEMNIGTAGNYSLTLFDMLGKKVAELMPYNFLSRGSHSVILDASKYHLSGNTYYYSLQGEDQLQTLKLVFLR